MSEGGHPAPLARPNLALGLCPQWAESRRTQTPAFPIECIATTRCRLRRASRRQAVTFVFRARTDDQPPSCGRAAGRLRAASLGLERVQPHRRAVHAQPGPRRRRRQGRQAADLAVAAGAAAVPAHPRAAVARAGRRGGRGAHAAQRRVGRRRADARRRGAVPRLLCQRAADEAAGAAGSAPGAVRRLRRHAAGARRRRGHGGSGAACLRAGAAARDRRVAGSLDAHADGRAAGRRRPLRAASRSGRDRGCGRRGGRGPHLRRHRAALAGRDLAALQAACRGALAPLRAQLRDSVDYHLGRAVLRTRQVMLDVRRLTEPPSPARR
jgi:hypothetical protein